MLIGFNKEQPKKKSGKPGLKQQIHLDFCPVQKTTLFRGADPVSARLGPRDDLKIPNLFRQMEQKLFLEEEGIRLNENRFRACLLCLG